MIRRGRLGLTAPPGPGPGRRAFRGRQSALSPSGSDSVSSWVYLPGDVRSQ